LYLFLSTNLVELIYEHRASALFTDVRLTRSSVSLFEVHTGLIASLDVSKSSV